MHSPHQPIPAEVLNGALETKQLTPSQILSILAYDTERSDFHERIEKVANASAPACGIALAELADLREASLPKVRALARIAEGLRGTDRIIALDKAKRAARECHETFDRLCAAALVQRFSRTDRQSAARRIAAGLNACRARRCIPADVIVALAATSREIAGDFAHECIERSFVLSAFALDPSARQVFNLLPEEKRSEFIERATRSILEGTDNDHRNFIEVIEPHLDEVKRTALITKFRTQGIADEAVVLSRFDRLGPDEAADLAARLKEALLTKSGSLQEYSVVRWSGLLRHLTRDQRGALVAILLHEIALPIGSGQWTDLICDILPWLKQEERKGAIAAVLDQGRQHFDQVPTFVALGKGLQFLPTALRDPASRRLSKRINDYVQDRPMTGDPRRIQLALELLDQMDEANASTLARILFDAKQSQGHINVVTLGRIMPWLTGSRRETACDQIREWARTIPWSVVDVSSLIAVRHWLSEDDAQATINRFYQAAERDADDRLIARNLAYFLPLNEGEERTRLAGRLLDMASRTAEWDHSWFQVVEMIVRECDVLWLLAEVRSFITSLGLSNPHAAARLLVLLAARAGPGKGTELIEEALALHPYRAWPLDMVIESIPLLPRPVQADVLTEALRELSTEKRVGQFRALEALFPTLAALGGQDTIAAVWECIWEVTQLWS